MPFSLLPPHSPVLPLRPRDTAARRAPDMNALKSSVGLVYTAVLRLGEATLLLTAQVTVDGVLSVIQDLFCQHLEDGDHDEEDGRADDKDNIRQYQHHHTIQDEMLPKRQQQHCLLRGGPLVFRARLRHVRQASALLRRTLRAGREGLHGLHMEACVNCKCSMHSHALTRARHFLRVADEPPFR